MIALRLVLSLSLVAALGMVYAPVATYTPRTLPVPTPSVEAKGVLLAPRVSYYNPVEAQTDADPSTSACGPNRTNQIAVSRDLFRRVLDCGQVVQVYVENRYLGEFVVWDTMAPRFEGAVDVMTETSFPWGLASGYLIVED